MSTASAVAKSTSRPPRPSPKASPKKAAPIRPPPATQAVTQAVTAVASQDPKATAEEAANPPLVFRVQTPPSVKEELLSEIGQILKTFEEKLTTASKKKTVETGVGTGGERSSRLIMLRTETVQIERLKDEEKEQLRRDLVQTRRDNASLYVMLEERKQLQERTPSQVRLPEIPRLDLGEAERKQARRRLQQTTADKLRRLEDVLPRGFISQEIIRHEDN